MAGTAEDGKAGIFRKGGIGLRELAEEELGAFGGGDEARVQAIRAEAEGGGRFRVGGFGGHRFLIISRAQGSREKWRP